MSIVLYIGGSRDGKKGVVPHGFSKTLAETEHGPEIYVEKMLDTGICGRMRVMVLDSLREDVASLRLNRHLG